MRKKINLTQAAKELRSFFTHHKRPPSYEEIRRLFRYKSKNAAYWLVSRLKEHGVVMTDHTGRLTMPGAFHVRLLGSIQAGFPSPAEEELVDTLSLNDYLVRNPDQTYLVRVTGDSMQDAGIHEGDLVIVERGRQPQNNDIVIAQVDEEWTMKYYEKQGKTVRLIPANAKYSPITPREELVIGGVITGVIRRYK